MQVVATSKSVHISSRKVRLVADAVRNAPLEQAVVNLQVVNKRGARILLKTLNSAIANAVNNAKLDRANLRIAKIDVVEGPQTLKRFHPSTRGRIHPYKKRMSHITVALEEKPVVAVAAPVAKPKTEKSKKEETK